MKIILKHVSVLLFILVLFSGCSSDEISGKTEAEVLYKEALDYFERGRFLLATEKVGQLKSRYPYSFYSTHAELLQADILFEQENFVEAAASYIVFKDLHPRHNKMSYVLWKIAESFYKQLPSTFDRDLAPADEAKRYYTRIIKEYPSSEYTSDAKERIRTAIQMQESKDKYIADFYYKTGVFDAARFRYLDILKNHRGQSLLEYARKRVVMSSLMLESYSDCVKYSNEYRDIVSEDMKVELDDLKKECTNKFNLLINESEQS